MQRPFFELSLLARDQKLFLELTREEEDVWIPRLFDRVAPHMPMIAAIVGDLDEGQPLNLEKVMLLETRTVREIAAEMACALLTPQRQRRLYADISAYCDELLAEDRALDAAYVQNGLILMRDGRGPGDNPLLVEVCVRSLLHIVSQINGRSGSL